ncbi:MAG: hypothetical protein PF443_00205 [Allgaiera sp.]|jgi:hypothetical protein|nr:hypothetical protein [Allgaiera sp.]
MTTALDIITDAFREGNLIPAGASPNAAQQAEGLNRLNRLIPQVFGFSVAEPINDWPVPSPQRTSSENAQYPFLVGKPDATSTVYQNPPKNVRVVWGGAPETVYLPQHPDDGSRIAFTQGSGASVAGSAPGAVLTLDGNGRLIEGAATLALTNPTTARQWLYRADLGTWTRLQDLALTDVMPFPEDFDDLWSTLLFVRLAPRYSKTVSPETASVVRSGMTGMRARYAQTYEEGANGEDFRQSMQAWGNTEWLGLGF